METAVEKRTYGEYDVWDFFDTTFSEEVPCNSAEAFFHLLFSRGSIKVELQGFSAVSAYATLKVWGPVTEDANPDVPAETIKQLQAKSDEELASFFGEEADKRAESGRTVPAFEKQRLWASYKITRPYVRELFETEEDRDALVDKLRKLSLPADMLRKFCTAMGLRIAPGRVK